MSDPDLALSVAKLVEEMRKSGGYPSDESLNRVANQIASAFNAKKEEIAILHVSSDGKMLSFVYPIRLVKVGLIPLSTTHSLATKTIRDKKGELVNNFANYKHPTVFEAIDLSPEEKATPIQKIMSAPMIVDGTVVGVIQVSRKAKPGESVGPDFAPRDLGELAGVGTILGKYMATLPPAPLHHAKPAAPPARA